MPLGEACKMSVSENSAFIFAETNVTLGGTYELARRLTVLFSPQKSCLRPYNHSLFIDSRGRSWLWCTCSECKLWELLELLHFCLLLQILSFKSAWGRCSEEQLYSEKHIPQKGDIMQVIDTVETDYNLFLPLKSAGKHYQWHWKENRIWQCCSFLVFWFLPHLSLNGKS